jgi:hypothetical protein
LLNVSKIKAEEAYSMTIKIVDAGLKFPEPLIPLNQDKVLHILLHHPDAKLYSPEQIHAQHIKNGWNGAGYNAYVRKTGVVYILRGMNIGAQSANYNSKSYGVCFEGDYDVDIMPQVQFDAGVEYIKSIKPKFKNLIGIAPHSAINPTGCPGKIFPLERMINAINNIPEALQGLYASIDFWQRQGVITSSKYWAENAIPGKTISGEAAAALLQKTADWGKLR